MDFGRLSRAVEKFSQTVGSIVKILLLSRRSSVKRVAADGDEIVVLGNGPSLNKTVEDSAGFLKPRKKLAVNFAANTPLFLQLKPEFYVLADPHFFAEGNVAVDRLWRVFAEEVDWDMVLFIPSRVHSVGVEKLKRNSYITVRRYNLTPVDGCRRLCHYAYRKGWGMPRPRNVLIPSIMLALNSGFRTVYVAGADHSWMRTLSVDGQNRVVSIQPHFYKDSEKETARVATEYAGYPLYKIVYSFYVAFKAYFDIRDYAARIGAVVYNITPDSFIDAFPRKKV